MFTLLSSRSSMPGWSFPPARCGRTATACNGRSTLRPSSLGGTRAREEHPLVNLRLTPEPHQHNTNREESKMLLASNYDQSKYFKAADTPTEKKLRIKS